MINDSRIILISYPTGGFGNFVYFILSTFGSNIHCSDNTNFSFSITGNSHLVAKPTPVYFNDQDEYTLPSIDTDNRILILCDNGVNNDKYHKINRIFKNHKIIRMVIDEDIRPVIYTTCVVKGMNRELDIESYNHVKDNWSDHVEDYSIRENYTLLYYNWPFQWNVDEQPNIINVSIKQLIDDPVATFSDLILNIGGTVIDHKDLEIKCEEWIKVNKKYFTPYLEWNTIQSALENNNNYNLRHISSLHDQGYINYKIERLYNITIPVYDYRNWFESTEDILKMIKNEKKVVSDK